MVYVLTHEYPDRSSFAVCGVTQEVAVATAWYNGSDETNVYACSFNADAKHWMEGVKSWRQEEHDRNKAGPDSPNSK